MNGAEGLAALLYVPSHVVVLVLIIGTWLALKYAENRGTTRDIAIAEAAFCATLAVCIILRGTFLFAAGIPQGTEARLTAVLVISLALSVGAWRLIDAGGPKTLWHVIRAPATEGASDGIS